MDKPEGVYVQFGCGPSCPQGWINFDASPTLRLQKLPLIGRYLRRGPIEFPEQVLFGDIVRGLPIDDGSAKGVFASHVLEHLSLSDFWIALENTFRMLSPGGIFRLVVPDLEARARKYIGKLDLDEANANSWFMQTTSLGLEYRWRGLEAWARGAFGNSGHLWMWDTKSMTAALEEVGFIKVRRCNFNDSKDKAFLLVEESSRFYDEFAGIEECAMEAIKPVGAMPAAQIS